MQVHFPYGVINVGYYLGSSVVSVILEQDWTRDECDVIREVLQQRHPNLPVVFGKELGGK